MTLGSRSVKKSRRVVNGSQTLARGLSALQLVANAPGGMTVQQVADGLGARRTIAYRLLGTLAEFRLIAKGDDGRYRPAAGRSSWSARRRDDRLGRRERLPDRGGEDA
ncbi:helix-turn-helix domain-containing protein, partial [Mycolicibacterium vaccae]|nr:helix-turn-helix domain-containing protein [Mycolicibacterium vaccae]